MAVVDEEVAGPRVAAGQALEEAAASEAPASARAAALELDEARALLERKAQLAEEQAATKGCEETMAAAAAAEMQANELKAQAERAAAADAFVAERAVSAAAWGAKQELELARVAQPSQLLRAPLACLLQLRTVRIEGCLQPL